MKNSIFKGFGAAIFGLVMFAPIANAALITADLGNTSHGLTDGDTPTLVPTILDIQAGQAAPFDAGHGNELFADPASVNWTFNYAAITDTILSATFSFGIWDHDTSASGSQLDAFSLDGTDTTTELNDLFEDVGGTGGSADSQYKEYTINLSNSFFAALADGTFSVDLDIGGAGLQTALPMFGGGVSETANNGYHLIFSTLSITTQDAGVPPTPAPEPAAWLLMLAGLGTLFVRRKSR